jgi:hypothetical protein
MSISAALLSIWGGIASPTGQAIIGLANLGGTTYTAVKASQNSNKLSSLQSSVYGIARDLKEVKTQTSDLFTISDMEGLISGVAPSPAPTTTAPTPTTTTTPTQTPPPAGAAEPAQDNMPAWAQQLIQQQMQQAEIIKGLMQNATPNVPANTTVNVNPTPTAPAAPTAPPATAPASVPTAPPIVSTIPDAAPAPAPVDPALMAFLQQQANSINELASAVTALKTSIGEIEAVIDDADSIPTTAPVVTVTPPTTTTTTTTPPTGGRG